MEQLPIHELWKVIHKERDELERLQALLDDIRLNGCPRCQMLMDGLDEARVHIDRMRELLK